MASSKPLPIPAPRQPVVGSELLAREPSERDRKPELQESAPWIVRTAICVEPRDGRMYVFMPPLATVEDYIDLLSALEDTAEALGMPVAMEGYPPPADPRLQHIKVTPDPGVI